MFCDKCKTTIPDTSKFCPKCGCKVFAEQPQEQKTVKCPQCGAENPLGAKFCKVDGFKLQPTETGTATEKTSGNGTLICPTCGTENPITAKFCKKDGTPLPKSEVTSSKSEAAQTQTIPESKFPGERSSELSSTIKCPRCGTENPVASKFCKKDGAPLAVGRPNDIDAGAATTGPAKEPEKKHNLPGASSTAADIRENRSKRWIFTTAIAVFVVLCAGGTGALYYFGFIGMNPSRVQKIINSDLLSKGFSVSVTVDDRWIARIEGTVSADSDKQIALDMVRSNKYVKDVVDNMVPPAPVEPPPQPPEELKPVEEIPASPVEEPKTPLSSTPSAGVGKPSVSPIQATPNTIRNSATSSLKKKGLRNVYLEVNEDMRGVLKGYVYSPEDKASALKIAKAQKGLRSVDDNIEVRQPPIPKAQVAPIDPAKLEGEINRAIRNAGISGVTAEVKDDMSVVLKGSVRGNDEKQRAIELAKGFRQATTVRDVIFVVGR